MSSPNTTLGLEYPPSRALSPASLVFWDLDHPDKTVIISATVERFLRAPENGNVNDDETYFVLSLRGNPPGSFKEDGVALLLGIGDVVVLLAVGDVVLLVGILLVLLLGVLLEQLVEALLYCS